MKNTQSFEWGKGTITMRPGTIRDAIAKQWIGVQLGKAGLDTTENALDVYYFCQFVTQSEVTGDIGWKPPASTDSPADLLKAYEDWLAMDEDLFEKWVRKLNAINADKVPEEQQPALDDEAKKEKA